MTKLFNFGAIVSWDGPTRERLHSGTITFKPGFDAGLRYQYNSERDWDSSDFRCLHLCFINRSTSDSPGTRGAEVTANMEDAGGGGRRAKVRRMLKRVLGIGSEPSAWKLKHYMLGELVEKDVTQFFLERD